MLQAFGNHFLAYTEPRARHNSTKKSTHAEMHWKEETRISKPAPAAALAGKAADKRPMAYELSRIKDTISRYTIQSHDEPKRSL